MVFNLFKTVHALPMCMSISLSVYEILLPKYMNCHDNFKCLSLNEKMASS